MVKWMVFCFVVVVFFFFKGKNVLLKHDAESATILNGGIGKYVHYITMLMYLKNGLVMVFNENSNTYLLKSFQVQEKFR